MPRDYLRGILFTGVIAMFGAGELTRVRPLGLWALSARARTEGGFEPSDQSATHKNSSRERSEGSSAALQTHRNLGRAYYEQGKYAEAAEEFRKVIASGQGLSTDHLDHGLALMQANALDQALGEFTTAKQMDPKLTAIEYNLGILYKRELRYPDAEAALERVAEADPSDPAGWFNLGSSFFAERKFQEALDAYQHVIKMGLGRGQNFYVASLFRAFTTLLRLNRQDEAKQLLKIHERVRDRVPNISLQNQALEGGKYGAILTPRTPPVSASPKLERVTFRDITARLGISLASRGLPARPESRKEIQSSEYSLDYARRELAPLWGPSIAFGDYDGDGRLDLYVVNPAGNNQLFHNNGDGTFTDVTAKAGVAGPGASLDAVFADYDNSGHPSLFVAGLGGARLYRNQGNGTFEDVTVKAGLGGAADELSTCAVPFDADSDGFLDLVVTTYTDFNTPPKKDTFVFPDDFAGAHSHFYRNNGDGTFRDLTSSAGLNSADGRMRGVVFADFTGSGYDDLVFFRDNAPPLLYANQGEAKFVDRTAEAGEAFAEAPAVGAQVADFNHDGDFDLVLWTVKGPRVLINRGHAKFTALQGLPSLTWPASLFALRGAVADLDGDSFADLLAVDARGQWHMFRNRAGSFSEGTVSLPAAASTEPDSLAWMAPAWLAEPGKLDLLALTQQGKFIALEKQGPPARWIEVKLKGFKSNTEGVGAVVELKAGNFYKKVLATGGPVRAYVGNLTQLDVVRTTWPNQVVQNAIHVATDKPLSVQESERLASSCPLLFVWDGKQYVFLTDVLGVAPIGELAPDGGRIRPNPQEYVRLPEILHRQGKFYTFQLTDELREVDYFDQLRLVAVDHPATQEIYANEIYSSIPLKPALYAIGHKRHPRSAVDERGHDVLSLILNRNGQYPSDLRRDRILGMADLHTLTLDLGDFPASKPVSLWLKGWVFWTDSNSSRALLSNSKLQMVSPYLQVRDRNGRWITVIQDMGLPSGANRAMRVDLASKFLSADHHVRIVTNLCVYWDEIFFTTEETPTRPSVELPLASADLHYRGFSTPLSDPRHLLPDHFEYTRLLKEAPWNPMAGNYTRYGDVKPLLDRTDDRLVVMATGDELTVNFDARGLGPLKPGWKRSFFLYASGYAKDGEPNTAFAGTVAPLPFLGMSNYPPDASRPASPEYERYLGECQTRPRHQLIPPLAPPLE